MYTQTNIPLSDIKFQKKRYAIACQVWAELSIKEKQRHLIDCGYNKIYAHRDLPFLYPNIRADMIDCMNVIYSKLIKQKVH